MVGLQKKGPLGGVEFAGKGPLFDFPNMIFARSRLSYDKRAGGKGGWG